MIQIHILFLVTPLGFRFFVSKPVFNRPKTWNTGLKKPVLLNRKHGRILLMIFFVFAKHKFILLGRNSNWNRLPGAPVSA